VTVIYSFIVVIFFAYFYALYSSIQYFAASVFQ